MITMLLLHLPWSCFSLFCFFLLYHYYYSYAQTLPSRCKKEIIHAADAESQHKGTITIEGLHKVIENIGASNMVSKREIEMIVAELENNSQSTKDTIQVATMLKIL